MAQDYTNDASGLLTTGYTSGGTTLIVNLASGNLPASGRSFYLKVDNEYFVVSSYTTVLTVYTLTVAGGQQGSTPSNHSIGATATGCWLLPAVIDGVRSDQSQRGVFASLPTGGMKKGDIYRTTDQLIDYFYNGSAWVPINRGCMQLIDQQIASNSASISFVSDITTAYSTYLLVCESVVPALNTAILALNFSTNNGSTYDSGSNYGWQNYAMVPAGAGNNGSSSDTKIVLYFGIGTGTGGSMSGSYRIHNPLGGSVYPVIDGSGSGWDTINSRILTFAMGGTYKSVTPANAFQLTAVTGNIASGNFYLYGIAHL